MNYRAKHPIDIALLSLLLRCYPRRFRRRFGDEMLDLYLRRRLAAAERSSTSLVLVALTTLKDTLLAAPLMWRDEWQRPRHRGDAGRLGESSMKNLVHESRLAARVLFTRQRSFTSLCVLTLALGLGAATAIFSVVHGVLLAPLPYGDPERIVMLYQAPPGIGWGQFSGPNLVDLRDRGQSFEFVAGYDDYRPEGAYLTGGDQVQRLRILRVGNGYFEALGTQPLIGRTFTREEETPPDAAGRIGEPDGDEAGEAPIEAEAAVASVDASVLSSVILSHDFWQRQFGGDRAALGSQLELDEQPFTVVGIMPSGLGGHVGGAPDIWLPLDLAPGDRNSRGNQYMSAVARLHPGVSLDQAQAELTRLTAQLKEEHPRNNHVLELTGLPLEEVVVGPSRSMLGLLFAAVAAMLAIACINVANLFLARGIGRQRELGLRIALGAGRKRLFAGTLIESLWIGLAGGTLGLGVAWIAVHWLHALRPAALPRYDALGLYLPVVGFSLAVVLLTVLVFGLAPALRAARADARPAFGDRGAVSPGGRRERRLRDFGVSLQVALSLVLLTTGGLLVRSFLTLDNQEMGFAAEEALTFQLRLPDYAYDQPEQRVAFYDRLFARLSQLPDLADNGATSKLPGNGHRNHWGFGIEGRERVEGEFVGAEIRCVAGDLLDALAIPVLAGRGFGDQDRAGTEPVVLVNQALVDRYLSDADALGSRLMIGGRAARTVVGVIGNARHDPREEPVPKIFIPQPQFADDRNWDLSFVVARAAGSTASWSSIQQQVTQVIDELDPRLVVFDSQPLAELVAEPISRQRFGAQLMIIFAALSLVLAAVGLFGALAYSLRQRRAEIGVRMALGADRQRVLRSVFGHGLQVFAIGAVLGLVGVFAAGKWLESLLHDIQPTDPTSILAAAGILLITAAAAAIEPARRASKLDPAAILRES